MRVGSCPKGRVQVEKAVTLLKGTEQSGEVGLIYQLTFVTPPSFHLSVLSREIWS